MTKEEILAIDNAEALLAAIQKYPELIDKDVADYFNNFLKNERKKNNLDYPEGHWEAW